VIVAFAGAAASCAIAIPTQQCKTAATEVRDRTKIPCDFMNLDSWAERKHVHGKEEFSLTNRR